MKFTREKTILPEFPKTAHLPHKPNTDKLDKVATEIDAKVIWSSPCVIEEKIDGSSCGMTIDEGEPLIRNRDHILRKGYHKKDSAAKMQFASVWNWWYEHKEWFEDLIERGSYSVFGEWMVAQHGIEYTRLPDWFIAYDIFDFKKQEWLSPTLSRAILQEIGFSVPIVRFEGTFADDFEIMETWANEPAQWADSKSEGIYLKIYKDDKITHRFKMVREDFVRGALWDPKKFNKNSLHKA